MIITRQHFTIFLHSCSSPVNIIDTNMVKNFNMLAFFFMFVCISYTYGELDEELYNKCLTKMDAVHLLLQNVGEDGFGIDGRYGYSDADDWEDKAYKLDYNDFEEPLKTFLYNFNENEEESQSPVKYCESFACGSVNFVVIEPPTGIRSQG